MPPKKTSNQQFLPLRKLASSQHKPKSEFGKAIETTKIEHWQKQAIVPDYRPVKIALIGEG